MPEKEYAGIIPVLKNLCLVLQPFACNRHITVNFISVEEKIHFFLPVIDLIRGFSKLISAIVDYVPDNNTITLTAAVIEKNAAKYVSIKIHNTGINIPDNSIFTCYESGARCNNNYLLLHPAKILITG